MAGVGVAPEAFSGRGRKGFDDLFILDPMMKRELSSPYRRRRVSGADVETPDSFGARLRPAGNEVGFAGVAGSLRAEKLGPVGSE